MTDKLYAEEAVKDIADAIREKNGSAEIYTVSQMGAAVRGIQTGVDTSDATAAAGDIAYGKSAYVNNDKVEGTCRYKKFEGEVVSAVSGAKTYVELTEDPLLAEVRNEDNLFIWLEFDIEPTAYTVKRMLSFNREGELYGWGGGTATYQYALRYDADAQQSAQTITYPVNSEDGVGTGIGRIHITEDGKLLCYANSINYAIRPCRYTMEVRW